MAGLEEHLADIALIISRLEDADPPVITLPDPSVEFTTRVLLENRAELGFETVFEDLLGRELFRAFLKGNAESDSKGLSAWDLHQAVLDFEKMDHTTLRSTEAKELYDKYVITIITNVTNLYIFPDKLASDSIYTPELLEPVEQSIRNGQTSPSVFQSLRSTIEDYLEKEQFFDFKRSSYFVRYLQWKYVEENIKVSDNDFKHYRKVGSGGFGDVFACSKSDTVTLHALKYVNKHMLLERKSERGIQMAFEERDMFCLFDSPFIVALNYAFQTKDKLCFVLDYMNVLVWLRG
eukprot:sb/3467580/